MGEALKGYSWQKNACLETEMLNAKPLIEVWRGEFLESQHRGHAVICNFEGEILEAWGDPEHVILPRSSCKILQALPLVTSGAAAAQGLTTRHLALACASHQGQKSTRSLCRNGCSSSASQTQIFAVEPNGPGIHRRAIIW